MNQLTGIMTGHSQPRATGHLRLTFLRLQLEKAFSISIAVARASRYS